jgi:hypothetical protein
VGIREDVPKNVDGKSASAFSFKKTWLQYERAKICLAPKTPLKTKIEIVLLLTTSDL